MMLRISRFAAALLALTQICFVSACASAPKPILYPNDHLAEVGEEQSKSDIETCRNQADAAGANRDPDKVKQVAKSGAKGAAIGAVGGVVGGAISGGVGRGAAIGAATGATVGVLSAAMRKPPVSEAHRNYVNRCLAEKGYEPMGWE